MNIVDISIKRPVATVLLLLSVVVFGALAWLTIPKSLFPNLSVPRVTIQTVYPGASPQVIENQITQKIEDQVASISDLDYITSYSLDSVSVVLVNFVYGKDENLALQEVKDKVEVILSSLPSDAKRPSITKIDISSAMPVMNIVLEGDMSSTELYNWGDSVARDAFSQVSGVGSVSISGGQKREIQVALERSTVFERNIPVEQIAGLLAAANVELPGGNVQIQNQDIPVRLSGNLKSIDQMQNLDIPTRSGPFKLRQLARVEDASTTSRERTIILDKKSGTRNEGALLMKVTKNPTANTIDVVEGVLAKIKTLEASSGGKIHFKVVSEDATFVRDSVADTMSNVYMGIILTGLVLLFFLHDLRSTLIVALAMPFSIIGTFFVLKAMGISLNMISLMGLSSSTGTLVANSVVVLENIFRYKELGHDRVESASRGTKEVLVAVFASTLTNIAVFVPLANMPGVMGATLADFAWAIVIATVFSIVVSFTLTPLMASRILPHTVKKDGKISQALEALFTKWETWYRGTLTAALKNKRRALSVIGGTVALFIVSMGLFSLIKFELMPTTDGGKIQISVELPQGSDLDKTATVVESIEKRLDGYKEIEAVLSTLGSLGSMDQDVSMALIDVLLVERGKRDRSNSVLAMDITRALSDIPGVTLMVSPVSEIRMSSGGAIDFYLKGPDNEVLREKSELIREKIAAIPGIMNASVSTKTGKAELVFEPNRKRIAEDGLTVKAIAVSLRAAIDGLVTTTYKDGGKEYDIRVTIEDADLLGIENLKNIPIVSAAGTYPLSRYAKVSFSSGYSKIMRNNRSRTVDISAGLLPGYSQGKVLKEAQAAAEKIELPPGYSLGKAGSSENLGKTVTDLVMVFITAVLLTYILLGVILESFTQPLFILATVPLSLIGVVFFCLVSGTTLNFIAMLGIIMLVGIVVNNAILILDYYNQLKREGRSVYDSLIDACPTKLKPILMSNIAIILGMVPMALGIGASGAEMRQPMGVVIIGGIVSSTVMTLWFIPALEYLITRHPRQAPRAQVAEDKE